jgi:hypothetical protein
MFIADLGGTAKQLAKKYESVCQRLKARLMLCHLRYA